MMWRIIVCVVVCWFSAAQAGSVSVVRDVAYGAAKRQTYDVYLPEGDVRGLPVLVMVHGGAWQIGDKAHEAVWEHKVEHYVPQGVVFISVNYRMLPEADVGQQAQDVALALAHIQEYGAKAGWDMSRMTVMGHSAGAHLVVLVSVDPRYTDAAHTKPWLTTVALDSGALDVPEIMSRPHFRFFDAPFGSDPKAWERYSPLHHVARAREPMLLVCSSKRAISCSQAQRFEAAYRAKGAEAYVLPKDLNHGDINDELGADVTYTTQVDEFLRHVGWWQTAK